MFLAVTDSGLIKALKEATRICQRTDKVRRGRLGT